MHKIPGNSKYENRPRNRNSRDIYPKEFHKILRNPNDRKRNRSLQGDL